MAASSESINSEYIQSYQDWKACESFTDLRDVNIRFLKGEIYDTPYHLGRFVKKQPQYFKILSG